MHKRVRVTTVSDAQESEEWKRENESCKWERVWGSIKRHNDSREKDRKGCKGWGSHLNRSWKKTEDRQGEVQHTSRAMLLNASSSAEKRSLIGARFRPGVPMSSPAPPAALKCSQEKEWSVCSAFWRGERGGQHRTKSSARKSSFWTLQNSAVVRHNKTQCLMNKRERFSHTAIRNYFHVLWQTHSRLKQSTTSSTVLAHRAARLNNPLPWHSCRLWPAAQWHIYKH